jgi:hypothetical protein
VASTHLRSCLRVGWVVQLLSLDDARARRLTDEWDCEAPDPAAPWQDRPTDLFAARDSTTTMAHTASATTAPGACSIDTSSAAFPPLLRASRLRAAFALLRSCPTTEGPEMTLDGAVIGPDRTDCSPPSGSR